MRILRRALLIAIAVLAFASSAHAESVCVDAGAQYPMPGHPGPVEVEYCVPVP